MKISEPWNTHHRVVEDRDRPGDLRQRMAHMSDGKSHGGSERVRPLSLPSLMAVVPDHHPLWRTYYAMKEG